MPLDDAHALVIGISRYQHVDPLRDTGDAQDMAAALVDPDCCGYPPAGVRRLLDEEATRDAILDALDVLGRTTHAGSTVFIYFSGHGAWSRGARDNEDDDTYYLIPVDAVTRSRAECERTAISNTQLTARLRAIPAGRLTLVLDCCHSGDLAVPRLARAVAPLALGRGRAVLAGSRATDGAYMLPGEPRSMLTGCLLDGLRGAAPRVDGVIRICDLFHYVQQSVKRGPAPQHPVFKAELEENYPIAQLRGATPEPLAIPVPADELRYDAFISYCRESYCREDTEDRAWVTTVLVPFLEQLGLRLCLEHRDFRLGASRIDEIERAVTQSRYTVAVFTPAFLDSTFELYQALLAAHVSIESRAPRLVPLIRRPCSLVLHARMAEALDVSRDAEVPAALRRLAVSLRQEPRLRLDPWSGLPPA
jgi:hypothetical protein